MCVQSGRNNDDDWESAHKLAFLHHKWNYVIFIKNLAEAIIIIIFEQMVFALGLFQNLKVKQKVKAVRQK